MGASPEETPGSQLDDFLRPFEEAVSRGENPGLEAFLPLPSHPLYLSVLCELVRIDLERGHRRGQPLPLAHYQERFPDLFVKGETLAELAYEDYRLRCLAGERPSRDTYHQQFGVDTSHWPIPSVAPSSQVKQGQQSQQAPIRFPEIGEQFLDFQLEAELGRGSFACVYRARQAGLAGRPVALKVSPHSGSEPRTLAQLQHTHMAGIHCLLPERTSSAPCTSNPGPPPFRTAQTRKLSRTPCPRKHLRRFRCGGCGG
jgi:hypothetical protein